MESSAADFAVPVLSRAAEEPWRARGLAPLWAPLPHLSSALTRVLCRAVVGTAGRMVTVENADRLARLAEPAIFALNHSNSFEALLVPAVLLHLRRGRPVHFLADWMFVEAPGLGWLLRRSEPIPVYSKPARWRWRERHRLERLRVPVLDTCTELLRRGESIGIFPEGTRNRQGGGLLRGRLGLGQLALAVTASSAPEAAATSIASIGSIESAHSIPSASSVAPLASPIPVVPIAIRYPAASRLGRTPRVGRLVLSIGEALDFTAERRLLAAAPERRRELARRVVDRVMGALAAGVAAGVGEAQSSRNRSRSEAR